MTFVPVIGSLLSYLNRILNVVSQKAAVNISSDKLQPTDQRGVAGLYISEIRMTVSKARRGDSAGETRLCIKSQDLVRDAFQLPGAQCISRLLACAHFLPLRLV